MSELDHEIRRGLERLTDSRSPSGPVMFEQLVARRRQRRTRNAALVAVPVVAVFALVVGVLAFGWDDDSTNVATGQDGAGSSPSAASPGVTVQRTEVVGGDGGTARVVMEFDGALPGGDVGYVEDITSLDGADGVVYTIQDARSVQVCDSTHFFPPPAEGTVDLLIPAEWFAAGDQTHTSPLETTANPAKFVVCGPHDGFYQYSIWGPVSADPADVTVTIAADRSRLTVEIDSEPDTTTEPPSVDPVEADAAELTVSQFLNHLRRGDLAAAAQLWTGYPEMGADAPPSDRIPFLEELLDDPAFSRILESGTDTFVTASWGQISAAPVVTVFAPRNGEDPPVAIAFLVGHSEEQGDPDGIWIHRLPITDDAATPDAAGSYVEPGQQIVIPGSPVEGGARAYIGETEIPVNIDQATFMTITIPDAVEGDVAITLSTATPELPGVQAFALTVRAP